MADPILLPAAARVSRLWKNGGGLTATIVSNPPGNSLDDFWWRLSIAEVHVDGSFSIFEGVDRLLVVLSGSFQLYGSGIDQSLVRNDTAFTFSGEIPVYARLLDGPARNLNLLVRTERCDGRMRVMEGGTWKSGHGETIVFAPDGGSVVIDDVVYDFDSKDAVLLRRPADIRSASRIIVAEIQLK
jgi:hypothetical protein